MTARLLPALLAILAAGPVAAAAPDLDLTRAVVLTPPGLSGPAAQAVRLLVEEVEARSLVRWDRPKQWPAATPRVVAGPAAGVRELLDKHGVRLPDPPAQPRAEGYQIGVAGDAAGPVVWVAGNDPRGVLFAVGRLLR